jgi:hypothetical protein
MYVITLEVEPKPGTPQAADTGGAYAVCWINFQLQDGAELLAKYYVEQGGWTPKNVDQVSWVEEGHYDKEVKGEEREELKQYYAEAEEDGVCVVFYQWPPDAEDAHVDYS